MGYSSLRAAISLSESPLSHLSPTDFDEGCSPLLFIARNLALHGLTTSPSPKAFEPLYYRASLGAIFMGLSAVFVDRGRVLSYIALLNTDKEAVSATWNVAKAPAILAMAARTPLADMRTCPNYQLSAIPE